MRMHRGVWRPVRRDELKIKLEEHMQEVEAIKAQILEHMVHEHGPANP